MIKRLFSPINIIIVSILTYYLYNHYKVNFETILNLTPIQNEFQKDRCEVIKGPTGCEDIKIPRGANFAILACGHDVDYKKSWGSNKFRNLYKNPLEQKELDKIYHFDLESNQLDEITIKNLPVGHTLDVHGFDIISDPSQKQNYLLYLINHMRNSSETVEKFRYDPRVKELSWFATEHGQSDDLISPNELSFVDADNYLVTCHSGFRNEFLFYMQMLGMFKGGRVTHFKPNNSTIISSNIHFANGIAPSKDGKLLFISGSFSASIEVFKITKNKDNEFEFIHFHSMPVDMLPDNINVDAATGDIFVTGTVNPIEALMHLTTPGLWDGKRKCGFRVIRIKIHKDSANQHGYKFETETVLEHDGSAYPMGTVSAPHSKLNRVLIGTLFTEGVLNCRLTD